MNRPCETVALIPARGGSKGILRKNIRLVSGKPLIAYAIETAIASQLIDRVIVSTDDSEIAEIAKQYGAEVPFMRPSELATDNSPEWLTWQHAIRSLQVLESNAQMQLLVCIPPTSPLRLVEDVDKCILSLQNSDADLVFAVRPAQRNPYFNMVVLDDDGYARLAIPPDNFVHRRQDAPVVYDITTIAYAARPDFVLNAHSMFDGKVKCVLVPEERSLDIDTEFDLKLAELLIEQSRSEL